MCFHPLTIKWQLIMRLYPVINKQPLTSLHSFKIHVLAFLAVSISVPIMVEGMFLR